MGLRDLHKSKWDRYESHPFRDWMRLAQLQKCVQNSSKFGAHSQCVWELIT